VALTLVGNFAAGMLAGRSAQLSPRASSNIGLTIVSRGEFSIIMANLARTGSLLPILQPFAALYVLVLAILGPLLTMQSRAVFEQLNKVFHWRRPIEAKENPPRVDDPLQDQEPS
jgi:CPA2 family monovalent cation:H+ antiporter-2